MKSLQESLFDKDLTKKDVEINFDTLRDMLFDFGKERKRLFDKSEVVYHEGRQSIFIKRFIDDSRRKEAVCFELEFGVTNVYNNDKKMVAAFNTPVLKEADKMAGYSGYEYQWKYSQTAPNTTSRLIEKEFNFKSKEELQYTSTIIASNDNITGIFKLYDGMVEYFCSEEFKKILQRYVNDWEGRLAIPGIILDELMKKLIKKA